MRTRGTEVTCLLGAIIWLLLFSAVTNAGEANLPDVWVVNEGTRDLAIIDPATDEVVARVALDMVGHDAPRPWG